MSFSHLSESLSVVQDEWSLVEIEPIIFSEKEIVEIRFEEKVNLKFKRGLLYNEWS